MIVSQRVNGENAGGGNTARAGQGDVGLHEARDRMLAAGLPEVVVSNFERLYRQVASGETGIISEAEIEPIQQIDRLVDVQRDDEVGARGAALLDSLVVVRLNGGLGTTMGLERAKSLLAVKGDLSFNDVIARQLVAINKEMRVRIPLVHMTSFSTDGDVRGVMAQYGALSPDALPTTFLQHKHPKIYVDTLMPANEPDDELNWNPPGHGDIYAALLSSGIAEHLIGMGKRFMFVANSDNLGATVDPAILGYLERTGSPFLMETAERTVADSKGGHLARRRSTGRMLLRESGQAPTTDSGELIPEFRDTSRYNQFNTNNIWIDLVKVVETAKLHSGCIPLPLISNRKTVNPRDKRSARVIQIETAMGAAIELFDGATALQVPRTRFAPVKSNNDLLVVRSDAYTLGAAFDLICATRGGALPVIQLDPKYFGLISDFDRRMKVVPSLRDATSLTVRGDVVFSHPLAIRGAVTIVAKDGVQATIPSDLTVLEDRELHL